MQIITFRIFDTETTVCILPKVPTFFIVLCKSVRCFFLSSYILRGGILTSFPLNSKRMDTEARRETSSDSRDILL